MFKRNVSPAINYGTIQFPDYPCLETSSCVAVLTATQLLTEQYRMGYKSNCTYVWFKRKWYFIL